MKTLSSSLNVLAVVTSKAAWSGPVASRFRAMVPDRPVDTSGTNPARPGSYPTAQAVDPEPGRASRICFDTESVIAASGSLRRCAGSMLLFGMAVGVLSGCSSDDDDTVNPIIADTLAWEVCTDQELADAELDCARLDVPVDYTDPDGETLSIALVRRAAAGERRGALLWNPGGPGGSGVEMVRELAEAGVPQRITDAFDLIGFDPRGVAMSDGIDCGSEIAADLDDYPTTDAAVADMVADIEALARECSTRYGSLLVQLGSNNVVRDMDRIRAALGEDTMNFIGYSYGTRLGSLYLELFPDRVGKLVLDASLPPEPAVLALTAGQVGQMQANLSTWLQGCTQFDASCDPAALGNAVLRRANELLQLMESDDEAIAAMAAQEVDVLGSLVQVSVTEPGVGDLSLAPVLSYLETGDSNSLVQFANLLESLLADEDEEEGSDAIERAVICADDSVRPDVSQVLAEVEPFNQLSDLFAEASLPQAAICAGWPAAVDPVLPVTTQSLNNVVVIGGIADANTPLAWSQQMAAAIGSPLITSTHRGHTVVFSDVSSCVDDQIVAFLLDDQMPQTLDCDINEEE